MTTSWPYAVYKFVPHKSKLSKILLLMLLYTKLNIWNHNISYTSWFIQSKQPDGQQAVPQMCFWQWGGGRAAQTHNICVWNHNMTTPSTSLQLPPAPKLSWCGHTGRPVSLKACYVAGHGQRKCSTIQNVTKVLATHQSYHWKTWLCHNWAAVYAHRSFPHTAAFLVKASMDSPSLYCTVKCTQVNGKTLTCVNITAQSPKNNKWSLVLSPCFVGWGLNTNHSYLLMSEAVSSLA